MLQEHQLWERSRLPSWFRHGVTAVVSELLGHRQPPASSACAMRHKSQPPSQPAHSPNRTMVLEKGGGECSWRA